MILEDKILKELRNISKILILSNSDRIESQIGKYATTTERKKIWVLIDGKREVDEIAQVIGITRRGVDKFLKVLEDSSMIERPFNKPPTRLVDYVPVEWVELIQTDTKPLNQSTQKTETSTVDANETPTEVGTHG